MTERDEFYSKRVREGVLSRDEALDRLVDEETAGTHEVEALLQENGIGPALLRNVHRHNRPLSS